MASSDKRAAYKKCAFRGCTITSRNKKNVSLHCFPVQDTERLIEWIVNSGNDDFADLSNETLKKRYICTKHFAEKHKVVQIKLTKDAVPILYDLSNNNQMSVRKNSVRKRTCKHLPVFRQKVRQIEQLTTAAQRLRKILTEKNKKIALLEREIKSYKMPESYFIQNLKGKVSDKVKQLLLT